MLRTANPARQRLLLTEGEFNLSAAAASQTEKKILANGLYKDATMYSAPPKIASTLADQGRTMG